MSMVNTSTSFTPFQLLMGRSPHLIPPLAPSKNRNTPHMLPKAEVATSLLESIALDTLQAQDNLLTVKVAQSDFANRHRGDEVDIREGNQVLLSTKNQWQEYIQSKSGCMAKFMPRYNGPFVTTTVHPETSNYTLHLPNEPN